MWVDYQNTWLGAQQNTSPNVIGVDGKYSYQRAPEEWQTFYQWHDVVYQDVFVILLDPANGQPTVWLRNPKMRESRLLGSSRVLSWSLLPGGISRAPRVAQAGRAAAAVPYAGILNVVAFQYLVVNPLHRRSHHANPHGH